MDVHIFAHASTKHTKIVAAFAVRLTYWRYLHNIYIRVYISVKHGHIPCSTIDYTIEGNLENKTNRMLELAMISSSACLRLLQLLTSCVLQGVPLDFTV